MPACFENQWLKGLRVVTIDFSLLISDFSCFSGKNNSFSIFSSVTKIKVLPTIETVSREVLLLKE